MCVYVGGGLGILCMCSCVCVKWADKGCEGRYVALSFRGQGTSNAPLRLAALFARSMKDGFKMDVSNVN